jgi:hypothetical protein
MKSAIAFVTFLVCSATLLGNQTSPLASARKPSRLLDELVQMTQSGSSDAEVLAYAQAHRRELPPELSDRDLRYLRESGVSARVVNYMSAIDVRASDDQLRESPAYPEDSVPPSGSYAYPPSPDQQSEDVPYGNGQMNGDVSYSDSYAGAPYSYGGYGGGYCDPFYDFSCYNPFGFGFYSSPLFFFFPSACFFHSHKFHDHHGHVDHHWHDGGNRPAPHGNMIARSDPREAWRERGFNASSRRSTVVGPRGSARTAFARQGIAAAPRGMGRAPVSRGFATSRPARGSFAGGFRGPTPSFGSRGSVSRPSFSGGGMRSFSSGGMRGFSGGGSSGGRGRH